MASRVLFFIALCSLLPCCAPLPTQQSYAQFVETPLPFYVQNVAALQTARARTANGGLIDTAGYTTSGDNGGDRFIYRRTGRSGITLDSGFFHAGPGADDYFEAVDKTIADLRKFGCKGDGATDDTARFTAAAEAAVEYGATLRIPKGEFLLSGLSGAINVTDNLSISGDGNQSILTGPGIEFADELFTIDATSGAKVVCQNVTFSTFFRVFNFTENTGQTPYEIDIRNCACDNFGAGLVGVNPGANIRANSIMIQDNRLTNMGLGVNEVRPWAIDFGIQYCPKTIITGNLIDGVGTQDNEGAVVAIWVDCTQSTDKNQSVVISNNIIRNVASGANGNNTDQIGAIFVISAHVTLISNVIDTVLGPGWHEFAVDAGTNTFTDVGHSLQDLTQPVYFRGDDLPAPLVADTAYLLINPTADTFQIEATLGAGALDITDVGSGTIEYHSPHTSSPEAIYTKASYSVVSNNIIIDVAGKEAAINCKGETGGFSSSQGSLITGNSVSYRTPPFGLTAGILMGAPLMTAANNMIDGCGRGVVMLYGGEIKNNVIRNCGTGVEALTTGSGSISVTSNWFDVCDIGINFSGSMTDELELAEFSSNRFTDFGDDGFCLRVANVSTGVLESLVVNNNTAKNVTGFLGMTTDLSTRRVDRITLFGNSLWNVEAPNIFFNGHTTKKTLRLLNTLNGGLWVDNDSPVPFDVLSYSGLVSWWKAADSSTTLSNISPEVAASYGQFLLRWKDKSATSNHMNEANPGFGGRLDSPTDADSPAQAVRFIAGGDMASTQPTSAATCTVIMALNITQPAQSFTGDAGTDFLTCVAHGLIDTNVIRLFGADLPLGLLEDTPYYVVNKTVDTFQVSLTSGGAAVDFTDAGTGTMTFRLTDPEFLTLYNHTFWGGDAVRYLIFGEANNTTDPGAGLTVGTPTFRVNGATADFSTAHKVWLALSEGPAIVTCRDVDFSTWDVAAGQLRFGGYPTTFYLDSGLLFEMEIFSRSISDAEADEFEAYLSSDHEIPLAP